jgi:hypothetical protein
MAFLRRWFGGGVEAESAADSDAPTTASASVDLEAAEREHELDVMRGEQQRLDELQQRQLRYSEYAWQPPAQGGERRADDEVESQSG